jgi:hypothetical protein
MTKSEARSAGGVRLRRLRLLGASGITEPYEVSFLGEHGAWRDLAVIAGPSQTGKTSVLDFVRYCLGGAQHPQHPEVLAAVRHAQLEVELAGQVTTIERAAKGTPSSYASVWAADLDALDTVPEVRLSTDTGDDAGLSQFVLAACNLDHVELPEAPSRQESKTQTLSIRDLFRLMWLPNERLDNKSLLFEQSEYIIGQKFSQTLDIAFGVLDVDSGRLAAQLSAAAAAARQAQQEAASLRAVVAEEYPTGPLELSASLASAVAEVEGAAAALQALDNQASEQSEQSNRLRAALAAAEQSARAASVRVDNRQSLLARLRSLLQQYGDDRKKLIFLSQAEKLFNPLRVRVCPACFSAIEEPSITGTHCTLCHTPTLEAATGSDSGDGSESTFGRAELRSLTRRLDDLQAYILRLESDLQVLLQQRGETAAAAAAAAASLNDVVELPAPFLAQRDALSRAVTKASLRRGAAQAGLRLWRRVEQAEARADLLTGQASRLRKERSQSQKRPDRRQVVSALSTRFGHVLADLEYPKLSSPLLSDRLVPSVRGLPYTDASSGGLTLISLAWYLALWEVGYETDADLPGLLMIDSPQKNLGHQAADDLEFADATLVENFYRHVREWLLGAGVGAQIVIVDNSPPSLVSDDVVVRYTRTMQQPPYGLIHDAVE